MVTPYGRLPNIVATLPGLKETGIEVRPFARPAEIGAAVRASLPATGVMGLVEAPATILGEMVAALTGDVPAKRSTTIQKAVVGTVGVGLLVLAVKVLRG